MDFTYSISTELVVNIIRYFNNSEIILLSKINKYFTEIIDDYFKIISRKIKLTELMINGNLNILKWCIDNGCQRNIYMCPIIVTYNKLDCLIYAHENGCEWDKLTCSMLHYMDIYIV